MFLGTSYPSPTLPTQPEQGIGSSWKAETIFALNHILCWEADDAEASEDGKVPMPALGMALWDPTVCFAETGALMLGVHVVQI